VEDRIKAALQRLANHLTEKQLSVLRFIVENFLAERHDELAAKRISAEFFADSKAKDPTTNVRNCVSEIRDGLDAYYRDDGLLDPVRFEIMSGVTSRTYMPTIEYRPYFEPLSSKLEWNHGSGVYGAVGS
jgi:hypothetical protein